MKVKLEFEKSSSKDVSIMIDTLRASTSIIAALDNFKVIIPAFTPEEAIELAKNNDAVLAGERRGKTIEGFDIGNSPTALKDYKTTKDCLVITTSNGVRVLENIHSKTILIGTLANAKKVAETAVKLASEEISLVMAGFEGHFSIEDFIGAGEILYWIDKELNLEDDITEIPNINERNEKLDKSLWRKREGLSEYAFSALLASRNHDLLMQNLGKSMSARRLTFLGYKEDVKFCLEKNISENVPIYKDGKIRLFNEWINQNPYFKSIL